MTVQVWQPGTVELKPECRKRLASILGVSVEDVKKAEAECDGIFVFRLDEAGNSTDCFALPFPQLEEEEALIPVACFVGYEED